MARYFIYYNYGHDVRNFLPLGCDYNRVIGRNASRAQSPSEKISVDL